MTSTCCGIVWSINVVNYDLHHFQHRILVTLFMVSTDYNVMIYLFYIFYWNKILNFSVQLKYNLNELVRLSFIAHFNNQLTSTLFRTMLMTFQICNRTQSSMYGLCIY